MATINIEAIATDITSEQISKCFKIIDLRTNEDFYQVESSTGECDYEVRYDPAKGLTCTCETGKHGFWNCKNYCWHVRASVAVYKQEIEAERKARAIENNVPAWIMR